MLVGRVSPAGGGRRRWQFVGKKKINKIKEKEKNKNKVGLLGFRQVELGLA